MTILTKSKKPRKAQPIADGDDSGLFYIDEARRKSEERQHEYVIQKMTNARNAYQQITGEEITSYEQFQEIVADPAGYYRKTKAETNVKEKKPGTLQLLDEGFDLDFIADKMMKLPEGFDEVIRACNAIKQEKPLWWGNYAYDGGVFTMSAKVYAKLLNNVYYYAATDLQKKRLALGNKFLELIAEWEELLRTEAQEAGVNPAKIQRAIDAKRFMGPLPFCLRYDRPQPLLGWGDTKQEVEVNPNWVVHGHKKYATQISLSDLAPAVDRPKWVDNTVYKRFWRTESDGGRRPFYVRKGLEKQAYTGAYRDGNIKFDDGEFYIRDGRFVAIENK